MFSIIGGVVQSIVSGIVQPLFGYLGKREDVKLDGFRNATGVDLAAYQAALAANVETMRIRAAANAWLGARIMTMAFGIPAALHWGAVFVVSTFPPLYHVTIPALPEAYASAELTIALSFFIVAPAMPIVSATAAWLSRK